MKTKSTGSTDKGRTRKNNEDAFLIDDVIGLYAVADGIGGHVGGEVASRMAVEILRDKLREHIAGKGNTPASGIFPGTDPVANALDHAFTFANAKVREEASNQNLAGMGTTMTAVLLRGNRAHLAHVGDSRAYLLRAGSLDQISDDHGVVAEQVRAGLITPEQARKSPYRHVITRALGIDPQLLVDHRTIEVRQDDMFLLCSDGLTEMVEDGEIRQVMTNAAPQTAAEKLIVAANARGGVDNITVVVIKIEELK